LMLSLNSLGLRQKHPSTLSLYKYLYMVVPYVTLPSGPVSARDYPGT